MEITILGPGCANCHKMEEMARTAVKELGIEATIGHIFDMQEIMKYTMTTPGLLIDGKLKHSGRPLPSPGTVKMLIREAV